MRKTMYIGFVTLSSCAIGCSGSDPIPHTNVIETITAEYNRIDFDIPKERWEEILCALKPAERDDHPAKWQVLGGLVIKTRDGRQLHVFLYKTMNPPGAFSAGETFETRVYYRGGNSQKLEEAIQATYREHLKESAK